MNPHRLRRGEGACQGGQDYTEPNMSFDPSLTQSGVSPSSLSSRGDRLEELSLPAGTMIGQYTVTSTIASGGCGTVYAAAHCLGGQKVALKVLHSWMSSS